MGNFALVVMYSTVVNWMNGLSVRWKALGALTANREVLFIHYQTEKWILELCDAYEKKYGVWETDAVNWISGWFVLMDAIKKADSLDVEDLTKALDGMEFQTIYSKGRFVARPDKKNARTCDSVGQQFPGIIRKGKFEILKKVSIDENYKKTIQAFGLGKLYGLK